MAKQLCLLEIWFPLAFFDLMIHFVIHLIDKIKICGSIGARWCYLVEIYLNVLKMYTRNEVWLEPCITSGYMYDEALGFCILHYIHILNIECGIPMKRKRIAMRSLKGRPSSRG